MVLMSDFWYHECVPCSVWHLGGGFFGELEPRWLSNSSWGGAVADLGIAPDRLACSLAPLRSSLEDLLCFEWLYKLALMSGCWTPTSRRALSGQRSLCGCQLLLVWQHRRALLCQRPLQARAPVLEGEG